MSQPQPHAKDPAYKVKNTFLEFSIPAEDNDPGSQTRRRTRSDGTDLRHSPLVIASKSPTCSPQLQPVDETMQAVPIDEVSFELLEEAAPAGSEPSAPSRPRQPDGGEAAIARATPGLGRDEPAYVVPTTPSPFLRSAFPPSVVPPFGAYGYGIPDLGLPPAFGEGDSPQAAGEGAYELHDVDGQYLQGVQLLEGMYDPNYGQYMPYDWASVPMDGGLEGGPAAAANDVQEQDAATGSLPSAGPPDAFAPGSLQDAVGPGGGAEGRDGQDRMDRPKEGRRGKGRARDARGEERAGRRAAASAAAPGAGGNPGPGGRAEAGGGSGAGAGGDETAAGDGKDAGQETPGVYTTVMLRNIPNKYTREMLVKQLSVDFNGQFDFMYLPIDFKNKCNVGYGFINFRTVEACDRFVRDFHGVDVRKCLPGLNSKKVVEVTPARVQGLAENVRRLRNSPVMSQLMDHPEWMPLLFNDSGEEEPFPSPEQPLPPVKPRGRNREGASRDSC
uniref:RRM domain-containing protein n=1 Tax=Alexandrium monilatum TaxID=311494 RepID=A0A7S4QJD8_9DINO